MPDKNNNNEQIEFNFEKEVNTLDAIYSDMVESIHAIPELKSLENLRLYVDNVYAILNRTAIRVKEIKKDLLADEKFIHETWNPPA